MQMPVIPNAWAEPTLAVGNASLSVSDCCYGKPQLRKREREMKQ
jgi:hypothetical protein